jgi:hypothetical protein
MFRIPRSHPQNQIPGDKVFLLSGNIRSATAVVIVLGSLYDLCPDRVEVKIPAYLQKLALPVDNNPLVPALKQETDPLVFYAVVESIPGEETLQHLRRGAFSHLDQKVHVV